MFLAIFCLTVTGGGCGVGCGVGGVESCVWVDGFDECCASSNQHETYRYFCLVNRLDNFPDSGCGYDGCRKIVFCGISCIWTIPSQND